MAERITVSGFRAPRARPSRRWRAHVPLVQRRNLIWLGALAGLYAAGLVWGTPHVLLTYTYTGPYSARYYRTCRYVGFDERIVYPDDGRCPVVRLLKADGRR